MVLGRLPTRGLLGGSREDRVLLAVVLRDLRGRFEQNRKNLGVHRVPPFCVGIVDGLPGTMGRRVCGLLLEDDGEDLQRENENLHERHVETSFPLASTGRIRREHGVTLEVLHQRVRRLPGEIGEQAHP